jgi:hypothetical protein
VSAVCIRKPDSRERVSSLTASNVTVSPNDVLAAITEHYLSSHDINGISTEQLAQTVGLACPTLRDEELMILLKDNRDQQTFEVAWRTLYDPLHRLISEGKVGALFIETDVNPHIIRIGFEPVETQLVRLATCDQYHTCFYPRPAHLQFVVDWGSYASEPYRLCLALGEAQLAYRAFDLSVLEIYRNDPRYYYRTNDVSGRIYIKTEAYQSRDFPESDKILLESFGFAYDQNFNRAVSVFLRYLMGLSPSHQQIWKAKELSGAYNLHPDYYGLSVIGTMPEGNSIFAGFLAELARINRIAKAMGRQRLFVEDYSVNSEGKPRNFGFLIRPTLEECNAFVLTLDKLLSENINRGFFGNDIGFETETVRSDGKIIVQQKGSLRILDEWVRDVLRPSNLEPWRVADNTLRTVRRLRQRPAHALDTNVFDQKYIGDQRDLIVEAYMAVRTLREALEAHPAAAKAEMKVPRWVEAGKIWIR